MLIPAELAMISDTKPVVSFTMNTSTSLTTNNSYNHPLVYLYRNE